MTTLYKVQVLWNGFIGAPGYTTFYQDEVPTDLAPYKAFFGAIAAGVPNVVEWEYPAFGVTVDAETGETNGFWTTDPITGNSGASGADYAGGVGMSVRWDTAVIRDGHRVKGHTYIVPTVGAVFDVDGRIDAGYRATVEGAADVLLADLAGGLTVWSRPKPGRAGLACDPTAGTVPNKAAIMRSRRD